MSYIKFLGDETENIYDFDLSIYSYPNKVKIAFNNNRPSDDILLSGFYVMCKTPNGEFIDGSENTYLGYTTMHKDDEDAVILSNDGSVYVEPEPIIEPAPYVPTLEEIKVSKIQSLSSTCKQSIIDGVDVDINGVTEHFAYGDEDQVNIKELFDLATQTKVPLYYHADGESCKLYTVEQIVSIYATSATNKIHHITYFNQLKLYVNTLETKEEVEKVGYGDELTGEYLDTYNDSMAQAQLVLETLLAKRASVSQE